MKAADYLPSESQVEEDQYPQRKTAVFACIILFLGYTLAFVDRNIVALLVVPIEHDLGLTDVEMGLLQGTAFAVFYSVFGLPIAWAVDRYNRRNIVAVGVAAWSAMTCLAGLSQGFATFFLARIGVGAGEATILPSATSLIADYFPPEARGRALGFFASGIYFGAAIALIGGGLILHRLDGRQIRIPFFGMEQPWQIVLISAGALGIPLIIATLFMREPIRRHQKNKKGNNYAAQNPGLLASLKSNPKALWAHFIGFTAMAFAAYGATGWLPTIFIRQYHWTPGMVGIRLGIAAMITGPAGTYFGGFLADRLEKANRPDGKFLVGALAAVCTFIPAIILGISNHQGETFTAAVVVIFFTSLVWGVAPAALQEIIHGSILGRVTAIYTALLNLIALGLAAPSIALLAEWMFGKNNGLGQAIAIIVPCATFVALIAFLSGRHAYTNARQCLRKFR